MKLAIMQPYLFPYVGYYQLVNSVDTFVFYDDVQFIKGGWINRNNILIDKKASMFTIALKDASANKKINQIEIDPSPKNINRFLKAIEFSYSRAPFFNSIFPLIKDVFAVENSNKISDLAISSVILFSNYLGMNKKFIRSSVDFEDTADLKKEKRLIEICHRLNADIYINPIGGQDLYSKQEFEKEGICLNFIKTGEVKYEQLGNDFVPNLSIIDVLMFNSVSDVKAILNKFQLV
ncbi:MAG: WbqC family protein [Chitinophagaceae bacterium]|nr:WbqC family protein [Chitinophagaceae bacterium]